MCIRDRACPDPKLMALDQEVSKRLEGTSTAALQSGDAAQLTLTNAAGDVLTFKGCLLYTSRCV